MQTLNMTAKANFLFLQIHQFFATAVKIRKKLALKVTFLFSFCKNNEIYDT